MSCCGVSNRFRCGSPSQNVVPAGTGSTSHWKLYETHRHANICLPHLIISYHILPCTCPKHFHEYLLISWVKGEAVLCNWNIHQAELTAGKPLLPLETCARTDQPSSGKLLAWIWIFSACEKNQPSYHITPLKTNMTLESHPFFNRKYILIHGGFSIVILVFRGKFHPITSASIV